MAPLQSPTPEPARRFAAIAPAVVAATAFAFADVSTKVTLHAEADVLTMALFRGMIGVPLLLLWLMVGADAEAAGHAVAPPGAVHRPLVRR